MKFFVSPSLAALLFLTHAAFAQSKLVPVTTSQLSGIALPTGSKKDSRLLFTATAQTLLDMEAEAQGIVLAKNVEVLSLPPAGDSEKQVLQQLADAKWLVSKMPADSYYLLTRDAVTLMAYIQKTKKETAVYFCSVDRQPATAATSNQVAVQPEKVKDPPPPDLPKVLTPPAQSSGGYAYTTTTFDDGWTAHGRTNWVEVTKGNVKVLIHFHTKETSSYISDYREEDRLAWSTFIVPRYGNINYIEGPGTIGYERPHFLYNHVREPQSGRTVYLALFSIGKSNWMEFIAPDQNTFIETFGVDVARVDYYATETWNPLRKMNGYNKFAVAATDLEGKWSSSFGGFTNYVNVYTGATTANTHSSAEEFVFRADGTYDWQLSTASGFVGNIKFDGAKSTGKFTMRNPWQIDFSEIEKKPRQYNAYFSCERNGARILWLQDTGYGSFTGFGKE